MKNKIIYEKLYKSPAVAAAADCTEAALRQWRKRHDFLGGTVSGDMKEKKFSLLDVCATRAVALMTSQGINAPDAIWIVHHPFGAGRALRALLVGDVENTPTMLAVMPGDPAKNEQFTFSPMRPNQFAATMADSGGIMTVIDLNAINEHVLKFFDQSNK